MDLLIIPVLLTVGGALVYLGVQGMPRLSLSQLPLRPNGVPFNLTDWLKARAATGSGPATHSRSAARDAELVDLMNEMIAVREELSGLKLAMSARPSRRRMPRPVAAETKTTEGAAARRQAYGGANRRYVRT